MLDFNSFPKKLGFCDVYYYEGSSPTVGSDWIAWPKPRGKSMIDILLVGAGGNGGSGVIGAASTAAGGGGGASGTQVRLRMPLHLLPDVLYISLGNNVIIHSYIAVGLKLTAGAGAPDPNVTLMYAPAGFSGSSGAGATGGVGGGASGAPTAAQMPLGWAYSTALAGQAGTTGGGTAAGSALTLPVTGLLVTGGTGGGGVGNSGSTGSAGGVITGAGVFPTQAGGAASGSQTIAPGNGVGGFRPIPGLMYGYGGTGGASTGGNASGAGLVQASGANGAPGCGGGGMGGALTGSTPGSIGLGGPSFCLITVW